MKNTTRFAKSVHYSLLELSLLLTVVLLLVFTARGTAQAQSPARVYRGFSTALGDTALHSLINGVWNTAVGVNSLFSDTTGGCNAAVGNNTLRLNTAGTDNTAIGVQALSDNTTGNRNTALGYCAGINLTTGDQNLDIDNMGIAGESRTMRIGQRQTRTFISGIREVTTGNADAVPVVIDSSGQLGTVSSSQRFKTEIRPIGKTSEVILALKPLTFRYKSDNTNTPQFGLLAEDVAKIDPDLVVRDGHGEIYTVRYEAVNAMLLNEFLKEHNMVQELKATIARQQRQIEAVTAGLQQVTEQLFTVTQPQVATKH